MNTEAQRRAVNNYRKRKKDANCISTRYYVPKNQHEVLKKLAKKTGKSLELLTNELVAESLKRMGYKL